MNLKMLDDGAKLITDDILIIEKDSLEIIPFKKPVTIKRTSPYYDDYRIIDLERKFSNKSFLFGKQNSKIIHIEDIYEWEYFSCNSKIDELFIISDKHLKTLDFNDFIKKMIKLSFINKIDIDFFVRLYNGMHEKPKSFDLKNMDFLKEYI